MILSTNYFRGGFFCCCRILNTKLGLRWLYYFFSFFAGNQIFLEQAVITIGAALVTESCVISQLVCYSLDSSTVSEIIKISHLACGARSNAIVRQPLICTVCIHLRNNCCSGLRAAVVSDDAVAAEGHQSKLPNVAPAFWRQYRPMLLRGSRASIFVN